MMKEKYYKELVETYESLNTKAVKLGDDYSCVAGFDYQDAHRYMIISRIEHVLHVCIFSNETAFQQYYDEFDELEKVDAPLRQDFILLHQADPDLMFDQEYEIYQKAGINVNSDVALIRSAKPGVLPWMIVEEEALLVKEAMLILELLLELDMIPEFAFYERNYDQINIKPFHVLKEMQLKRIEISSNTERLSYQRKGNWLVGTYYLPVPNAIDEAGRPSHSLVAIVVDEDKQEVITILESQPKEDPYLVFNEQMLEYMKENQTRPRTVSFFAEEDSRMLESLFRHQEVEIANSLQLELLNDAWFQIVEDIREELEEEFEEDQQTRTLH